MELTLENQTLRARVRALDVANAQINALLLKDPFDELGDVRALTREL
jgi:hypothetical protein